MPKLFIYLDRHFYPLHKIQHRFLCIIYASPDSRKPYFHTVLLTSRQCYDIIVMQYEIVKILLLTENSWTKLLVLQIL